MSIKKKLGLGAASAVLGLSLVVGGTWAAFNDTATISNHFASGTLNLEVGKSGTKPISFDLANMKPGDNVQRIFNLKNVGSLAIKEVLFETKADNFVDGTLQNGENAKEQFLSQFVIDFMALDSESAQWEPRAKVVKVGETLTLADLVAGTYLNKVDAKYLGTGGKINLAPLAVVNTAKKGIPAGTDSDSVFIQITFKNDTSLVEGSNDYVQNKFQGDEVDFFFNLEATQWDGVDVDTSHGNGAINNDVQGSADGDTMPNPRTEGTPKFTNPVND
jgi:spore coat-associated protein N